jgi:putative thiamine transport system ATP-binding protein
MDDLTVTDLTLHLGGRRLLGPLSFVASPGRPTTIMGPSGCGKSSLLAWLCGTLPPVFSAAGQARIGDQSLTDLPPERRRLGILFQDDLLFPHMTVAENLAFALPGNIKGIARKARVAAALAEAGLAGFEPRDPATLSGGQRARIALLRVLLSEPRALLLDEPFNRLDAALKARFRGSVFEAAAARGLPVLLVSHDPDDATAAGGPVIELPVIDSNGGLNGNH